jgi:hypothetical protein
MASVAHEELGKHNHYCVCRECRIAAAKSLVKLAGWLCQQLSTINKGERMKQIRNTDFSKCGSGRIVTRGLLLAIAIMTTCIAFAQDETGLKFKGGIGVVPVTGAAANGAVNLNLVRGVSPGGPWRIAALEAVVTSDGRIKIEGRGLLLASGNGIGTNAGQTVHATLFCGPAASATAHDSTGVALESDGDFRIDDFLSPAPPSVCETPVLLIRNAGGVWFAAGIQKLEEERHSN